MAASAEAAGRGLVVVVEDEAPIADLLRMYLTREGFGVHVSRTGPDGLSAIRSNRPVAAVVDVGLPGMDGTEICRILRAENDWTPVLFCTARDDEVDRVLGLELGADDYITKPFSPREVVARVKTVVRRSAGPIVADVREVGGVVLDSASHRVTAMGQPVELTATEFDVLEYLFTQPGRVFSREQILSHVWGQARYTDSDRTVDVHIAQIRSKLNAAAESAGHRGGTSFGAEVIRTVRGVGYAAEDVDPAHAH